MSPLLIEIRLAEHWNIRVYMFEENFEELQALLFRWHERPGYSNSSRRFGLRQLDFKVLIRRGISQSLFLI